MDDDALKEIKNVRKEAIDGLLKDVGFLDDDREKIVEELKIINEEIKEDADLGESNQPEKKVYESIQKDIDKEDNSETIISDRDEDYIIKIYRKFRKVEKKPEIDKADKINLSKIASNLNIIGKIRDKKIKEKEDYQKAIAEVIAKKDNLVKKS